MVTHKTYGHRVGFTQSGKKAHLARPDHRPLCTSRGVLVRFLDEGEGVDYDVLCAECLRERNRKALGGAHTRAHREIDATIRQGEWGLRHRQDQMLRRLR